MANLEIKRGNQINLPVKPADGVIYFCVDTGNIFIDYLEERIQLNAAGAQKLIYYDDGGELVELDAETLIELARNTFVQPEEPWDAPEGSLWVDTDEETEEGPVNITVNGIAPDENGNIVLPDYYTKTEIDNMFQEYIESIDALIG